MYRTSDPRFRRRLNELGQTVETATESAQSNLYIFTTHYLQPCWANTTSCLTACIDASCPALHASSHDRSRRRRGRAELSFDFYDDWDDLDDGEGGGGGLFGWGGNDEFERLLAGGGGGGGYGAVAQQPARQRGMSYPQDRRRRKSVVPPAEADARGGIIPGGGGIGGWWGTLFGAGRVLRYRPSAADLQDHPGTKHSRPAPAEGGEGGDGLLRPHRRVRSDTTVSGHTTDSLSSRGDIFPSSDEELADAIPLDDEFAMVLERRHTATSGGGGAGHETESSSAKTGRRVKRPSAGSRTSTRRTGESGGTRSSSGRKSWGSRRDSGDEGEQRQRLLVEEEDGGCVIPAPPTEATVGGEEEQGDEVPILRELKLEETQLEREEEAEVLRRWRNAQKLARERGLSGATTESSVDREGEDVILRKEGTPLRATSPDGMSGKPADEPSRIPPPLDTDDDDDDEN